MDFHEQPPLKLLGSTGDKTSNGFAEFSVALAFAVLTTAFVITATSFITPYGTRELDWEASKHDELVSIIDSKFDVVVLGNSKIFRGFNSAFINNSEAHNSCELKYYNAAIPGMSEVEFFKFLDAVDTNDNLKPKYVLFSPSFFRTKNNMKTERRMRNVTLRYLSTHLLSLSASDADLGHYKNLFSSLISNILNKSKFALQFDTSSPLDSGEDTGAFTKAAESSGYLSLNDDPNVGESHIRHMRFQRTEETWNKLSRKLSRIKIKSKENGNYNGGSIIDHRAQSKLLDLYVEKIQSLGATAVLIYSPDQNIHRYRKYYTQRHPRIPQIVMDNELDLFKEKELWFDKGHLSDSGANLYTGLVASKLCALDRTR